MRKQDEHDDVIFDLNHPCDRSCKDPKTARIQCESCARDLVIGHFCDGAFEEQRKFVSVDIVMSQPPGPESQFVECELTKGRHGIRIGEWIKRDDGYWVLRLLASPTPPAPVASADGNANGGGKE